MRYPDLDLDLLRCFITVADSGGFTAAASTLGVTQSAVSLKVKRLEELVGRRVFARTSRSLDVTADGEVLLGYARRLLSLNDEAVRRVIAPPVRGHLRLGVADHFVPHHLAPVLTRFSRTYPDVRLQVEVGRSHELRVACERGALDLAIAKRRDGETTGSAICTETLTWAASPAWFAEWTSDGRCRERGDAPLPLAMLPAGCMFRDRALTALARANIAHEIVYTSASILGVIAAAEAGLAATVLGLMSMSPKLVELPGLPELGTAELAVFGEGLERMPMVQPLIGFTRESLTLATRLRPAA
jgi:DNA-binding transcriptional LysR family regulator